MTNRDTLLLRVREQDRTEVLLAANEQAAETGVTFTQALCAQVRYYTHDYQGWTQARMNRYHAQEQEDAADRIEPGFAHHESLLP